MTKNKKAHLASIHSAEEQHFLRSNSPYNDMWIGGTDEVQEGSWTWSDGSPWVYDKWESGEPNNAGNSVGGTEDCWMMRTNGWNDVPCDYRNHPNRVTGFICSYSLAG